MPICSKCGKDVNVLTSKGLCAECALPEEKHSPEIKIEVSRDAEVESLQKELLEEKQKNESISSTLEFIARTDFETQKTEVAEKLSISPELIDSPEKLTAYKDLLNAKSREKSLEDSLTEKRAPEGGQTITYQQNVSGDKGYTELTDEQARIIKEATNRHIRPSLRTYKSEEELIEDLKYTAKNSPVPEFQKEANLALSKLLAKELHSLEKGESREYEVENSLHETLRRKDKLKPVLEKEEK
jgi:hypothetical protein